MKKIHKQSASSVATRCGINLFSTKNGLYFKRETRTQEGRMNAKEKAFRHLERVLGLPNFPNRKVILEAIDIAIAEREKELLDRIEKNLRLRTTISDVDRYRTAVLKFIKKLREGEGNES